MVYLRGTRSIRWRQEEQGGVRDERSTVTGRDAQGRIRPDIGSKAPAVEGRRPALYGVGDLPHQGVACRSGPAICIPDHRLVRTVDPALERRGEDLGAGGQQVRL